MLLIGDSGSGKTGALCSLAEAGYEVVIADFDKGVDFLSVKARQNPKIAENISVAPFEDRFKNGLFVGIPSAFSDMLNFLQTGKYRDLDLGPIDTWDAKRVFVLDSLTHASHAAMRRVLALSGKNANDNPSQPNWGTAQGYIENLLAELTSTGIKCNVIVCAHVNYYQTPEVGITKGLPKGPGQALSPYIPSYFNTMIIASKSVVGSTVTRKLKTAPEGIIEAKFPALNGNADYPLETGLASIFQAIRGATP